MSPYSSRFCAFASELAPASTSSDGSPPRHGYMLASTGLSIPSILPSIILDPTTRAPVLPPEMNMSPCPSLTMFRPTTIEDSVFLLIAFTGLSSIVITSAASTIFIFLPLNLFFWSSASIASFFPTIYISCFIMPAAITAPFTISAGA